MTFVKPEIVQYNTVDTVVLAVSEETATNAHSFACTVCTVEISWGKKMFIFPRYTLGCILKAVVF